MESGQWKNNLVLINDLHHIKTLTTKIKSYEL